MNSLSLFRVTNFPSGLHSQRMLSFILFLVPLVSWCQPYPLSIHTKYDDAFAEWEIFVEDEFGEEVQGEMEMRWKYRGDWTSWDFRIGEESGSIEMRFKNDPTQWEIRSNGEIISARMLWTNDVREWRITNNSTSFKLEAKFGTRLNEWFVTDKQRGNFEIYTQYEGDPRDWIILDNFDESVSLAFKMAVIFLTVFHSSPIRN